MRHLRLLSLALPLLFGMGFGLTPAAAGSAPGVGVVPQGFQSDAAYARSFRTAGVTNVDATTQRVLMMWERALDSIESGSLDKVAREIDWVTKYQLIERYRARHDLPLSSPRVAQLDLAYHDVHRGRGLYYLLQRAGAVERAARDIDIFEAKSVPPQTTRAKLRGEFIRRAQEKRRDFTVDWVHLKLNDQAQRTVLCKDPLRPVGAFDRYGNFYSMILPYQFFYNSDGSHNFQTGSKEPNPTLPNDVIAMAVRPHGATGPSDWISTHNGGTDYVATYVSSTNGNGPDKQWLAIDTNPNSPNVETIYAMWVDFHFATPVPFVSTAKALPGGTHTDWSAPLRLPEPAHSPQGVTYLLPHVDGNGKVYTTLTNSDPKKHYCCDAISVDSSGDGGKTWTVAGIVNGNIAPPPLEYANTQFRDGIEDTFTVGQLPVSGVYPLFVSYEDYSAGHGNVIVTASYDGGATWTSFEQVNDNASAVDAFQPNLTSAADGTISLAFYDRRLACPAANSSEAAGAGLAKDTLNLNYSGSLPPYGASNYCINSTIQFYDESLSPIGHNVRISAHTWDPQLNEPKPGRFNGLEGFIGDYYGNITSGSTDYTTSVSTFDDGTNPENRQQQIIATIAVP